MKKTAFFKAFLWLLILCSALQAEIPCVWTGVERVVAVGDLHGDYPSFIMILQGTKVVDEDLRWIAGRTHFVQTGDILDRGPDGRQIFDLLMRLEKEAEAAGGRVHVLIGNHEEMNISGIAFDYPDYITVEQFLSFLPEDYKKDREKRFSDKNNNGIPSPEALRAFWAGVLQSDQTARARYLKFFRENYGRWLAQHNAVIKIDGTVFVHGGISLEYSLRPLARINDDLRSDFHNLLSQREFSPKILYAQNGPLWYRELAQQEEAVFQDEVDSILANLKAQRMVIAHTYLPVVTAKAMRRFGGKVWIIDTGISAYYAGRLSALIIEGETITPWGVSDE